MKVFRTKAPRTYDEWVYGPSQSFEYSLAVFVTIVVLFATAISIGFILYNNTHPQSPTHIRSK